MHKVVVERPRYNPGRGKNGRRANLPDELLLKFEGIKRPHNNRKGLTDLLGPLRRWLQSQTGRSWNAVYSEACAVIKPDSMIRAHIKTHLLEFVERHTFLHDGQVCVLAPHANGGIVPVTCRRYGRNVFYVHPKTGLLQVIQRISFRERRRAEQTKPPVTVHWLKDEVALKQVAGLWFEYQFRNVPATGSLKTYDYLAGEIVGRGGLVKRNSGYWHCIAKRQLSSQELQHHGLNNIELSVRLTL
jgi:hypothetical protein